MSNSLNTVPSSDNFELYRKRIQNYLSETLSQAVARPEKTMSQLVEEMPPLDSSSLQIFQQEDHKSLAPPEEVNEIMGTFQSMIRQINRFAPIKRFFILETMDFFRSEISLGKLLPPLILLQGENQKKAIAEFIKPTFLSINKNVETLTATNQLFDPKRIHLERGSLYTFISDIAKILQGLFEPEYLDDFLDINSPVDLILQVLEKNPYFNQAAIPTQAQVGLVDDPGLLRKTLLEFITAIQSHEALYNYAIKRHAYYKLFLSNIHQPGKFRDIAPPDASKLLAAAIWKNAQLSPPPSLLKALCAPERFDQSSTQEQLSQFLNQLSPEATYQVILALKTSLQNITQSSMQNEFGLLQKLSVKNILKFVWQSFLSFAQKSIRFTTAPVRLVFTGLQETYKQFSRDEAEGAWEQPVLKPGSLPSKPIPKNMQSIRLLSQNYHLCSTDVISFREGLEGANLKDIHYNSLLFRQNEEVMGAFKITFEKLFRNLIQNEHLKSFKLPHNRMLKEHYLTFQFGSYILCLGITHPKSLNDGEIGQTDLFPYSFVLQKTAQKSFGRILERKLINQQDLYGEIFNQEQQELLTYESLYHIFHLLPEEEWLQENNQRAVQFLLQQLHQYHQAGTSLLFMERPPIPG